MQLINTITARINRFQQQHQVPGFIYAVTKKYGDDMGGYHAALLTYYGFLSLFPLLLVLTTIVHLLFHNNPDLRGTITDNVSTYFPLLGSQLQSNIQSMRSTGLGLAAGILITLYGARGGADALRFALDNMWHIPKVKRAGFPQNIIKSFSVMGVAALGFVATAAASAATSGLGKVWWVSVLLNIAGFFILSGAIATVFHIGASQQIPFKQRFQQPLRQALLYSYSLHLGGYSFPTS